jgi:hypothetical protein
MAEFKPLTEASLARAQARRRRAPPPPRAVAARFDRRSHRIRVRLDTGIEFLFDPRQAYGLEHASPEDLAGVTIEGAGGALHFPRLDADFSVARLLEGFLGPLDWTKRESRAAASRENGKRGGRPRKAGAEG